MSAASDKYEHDVAGNINGQTKGLVAVRPKVSTSFPDVKVTWKAKDYWVEVKMNHSDNLMNPRFEFVNNKWAVPASYKSPATDKIVDLLNGNRVVKQWTEGLRIHLAKNKFKGDIKKFSLYSSKTERGTDANAVSVALMKSYLQTLPNKNIVKIPNIDVGDLVTLHYTQGKAASAYYVSAGDDFYQFGRTNPLKIPKVPIFKGLNDLVLRVGDRSDNFEIQAEVKIKSIPDSLYSVAPGSRKPNPFSMLK